MSLLTAFAIYFVIWWLVLFTVLPWGVRTQDEAGEIVPGSEPGSPTTPLLLRKVLATTVIAAIVFALFYVVTVWGELSIDDIPLLPDYTPR